MDASVTQTIVWTISFVCFLDRAASQSQCYSCNYQKIGDIISGPENCYKPFNPSADGIEIVNCTGECDLLVQETQGLFQATRGCSVLSPCFESTSTSADSTSSIYCCSGSLCNDDTIMTKPVEPLADNECYVCTYTTSSFGTSGSPGCYEPFDASAVAIQKTQCSSSCSLTVVKSGEDVTVTRDCDEDSDFCPGDCVTSGDDSVCIHCCSPGTVCNKGAVILFSIALLVETLFVCLALSM